MWGGNNVSGKKIQKNTESGKQTLLPIVQTTYTSLLRLPLFHSLLGHTKDYEEADMTVLDFFSYIQSVLTTNRRE